MRTIYLYLNYSNVAVYADFTDNMVNKSNNQLKRFEMNINTLKTFIEYYDVKLHRNAILNIIK